MWQPDFFDDDVLIPSLKSTLSDPFARSEGLFSAPDIDIDAYDKIVVCLSGGKDSIAAYLRLLDMGVDRGKVEFWHHEVDGREGSTLMDWPFMPDYCRQFAAAMGVPLYFSWLEGGFEGEMMKTNALSRPHHVETPGGLLVLPRDAKRGKPSTRRKFPQQSASLATRWCSSALKIDVARRALNNQERFNGQKILFITGERREESPSRAKYRQLETHACDRRYGFAARLVDSWRPVLHMTEVEIWALLEKHGVLPPVPYRLGWGRSSCMTCIFNSPRIWATIGQYWPSRLQQIEEYEHLFGTTVSRKKETVSCLCAGVSAITVCDDEALVQASCRTYHLPVFVEKQGVWKLPPGAYSKEGCGPG